MWGFGFEGLRRGLWGSGHRASRKQGILRDVQGLYAPTIRNKMLWGQYWGSSYVWEVLPKASLHTARSQLGVLVSAVLVRAEGVYSYHGTLDLREGLKVDPSIAQVMMEIRNV